MKPKKYDWKDSNLALFGSDTEKQVKSETFLLLFLFDFNLNLIFFIINFCFVELVFNEYLMQLDALNGIYCTLATIRE